MAMNDTLSNALSHILNSENSGKKECEINNKCKFDEGWSPTRQTSIIHPYI